MRIPLRKAVAARMPVDDPVDRPWSPGQRACCCTARPVVSAVMPPIFARSHPVDLLLCGHHYQVSRDALAAAGAVVFDETGAIVETGIGDLETIRLMRGHG